MFSFPQLQTRHFAVVKSRDEFREGNQAVLVAVILLKYLVHDLLSPPEPLPLCRLCVLGGVVPLVALRDVLLPLVVIVVVVAVTSWG